MCHDDERICHKMIVLSDSLKLVAKLFHKRYTCNVYSDVAGQAFCFRTDNSRTLYGRAAYF